MYGKGNQCNANVLLLFLKIHTSGALATFPSHNTATMWRPSEAISAEWLLRAANCLCLLAPTHVSYFYTVRNSLEIVWTEAMWLASAEGH